MSQFTVHATSTAALHDGSGDWNRTTPRNRFAERAVDAAADLVDRAATVAYTTVAPNASRNRLLLLSLLMYAALC